MTARMLLEELRAAGFRLRVDGYELRVAPASQLTDDHRDAIRDRRDDLVRLLGDPDRRVRCVDCCHARGDWCSQPAAGLAAGYIGGISGLPQHCDAFNGADL